MDYENEWEPLRAWWWGRYDNYGGQGTSWWDDLTMKMKEYEVWPGLNMRMSVCIPIQEMPVGRLGPEWYDYHFLLLPIQEKKEREVVYLEQMKNLTPFLKESRLKSQNLLTMKYEKSRKANPFTIVGNENVSWE